MSKCVGCYETEAIFQRLCPKCLANFSVHVARPDELIESHNLLHLACKAVDEGRLSLNQNDYAKVHLILGTVCWVMGCPAGVPVRDLIIVIAEKMRVLYKQPKVVPITTTIQ